MAFTRIIFSLAFFSMLLILSLPCARASEGSLDPALAAARDSTYAQYGISIAKPGEYHVTIYGDDQVPLPASAPGPYHIYWVDNDSLIYVQDSPREPLTTEEFQMPGVHPVVTVNLHTFAKQEVARAAANSQLCYDYDTRIITFLSNSYGAEVERKYGVLGQPLWTFRYPTRNNSSSQHDKPYVNLLDCAFSKTSPVWTRGEAQGQYLRAADGYVYYSRKKEVPDLTSFVFVQHDGTEHTYDMPTGPLSAFRYDYFSHLYWRIKTVGKTDLTLWQVTRDFSAVSEATYLQWGSPISISRVKGGYLTTGGGIHVLNGPGPREIYNALYLVTHDRRIEVFQGEVVSPSVSPDGCKAAFVSNGRSTTFVDKPVDTFDLDRHVAVINLCK